MTLLVQPSIFGDTHTISQGRPLTARQQTVWELVQQTEGGVTAEEAGAYLHALKGRHPADVFCAWCGRDGTQVLRSKAVAPLVVRRRVSGRFEPREKQAKPLEPLPEGTWEDLFT